MSLWSPCSWLWPWSWSSSPVSVSVAAVLDALMILIRTVQTRPWPRIACPVDCQLSDWEAWTPCNPYCLGNQQRTGKIWRWKMFVFFLHGRRLCAARSRNIISLPYAGGAACGDTSQVWLHKAPYKPWKNFGSKWKKTQCSANIARKQIVATPVWIVSSQSKPWNS